MRRVFYLALCGALLSGAGLWRMLSAAQDQAAPATPPGKRALLVGISQYARGHTEADWPDLHAQADVAALRQTLLDRFQFRPEEIKVLTTREETTRQAILGAFRSFLIEPARAGDVIYFHYSGHGAQIPDPTQRKLSGMHQCLVPSDYTAEEKGGHYILDDEIRNLLKALRQKRPANVTLSFDCCYSGTITRGGRMLVRGRAYRGSKPAPLVTPRGEETGPGGLLARGEATTQGYVVLSATRQDEKALETEDDSGRPMGLLSYALVKTLSASGPQTTYRDLFERLTETMSRRHPYQNPQLEGELDQRLLTGLAQPPEPYLPVRVTDRGDLTLLAGELQGMTKGSRFAIYPAGTKDFKRSPPLAEAEIVALDLTTATLKLTPAFADQIDHARLQAARAVETAHHYGDNRLKVDAQSLAALSRGKEWLEQIRTLPLVHSEAAAEGRWDVRVRAEKTPPAGRGTAGEHLVLERYDGSIIKKIAGGDPSLGAQLREALEGESRWRFVKALENRDPYARVRVEMRLVPVKDKALARTEGGHIVFREGDHFQIELKNTGYADAYVTLLDLRPDGKITPIWPVPRQARSQDNKIPAGGDWRPVPDKNALCEATLPLGMDTIKLIATRDPADFSPLLDREELASGVRGGAEPAAARSPLGQLLKAMTLGRRAAAVPVETLDWATAAVSIQVAARGPGERGR